MEEASDLGLSHMKTRLGGLGGVITVDTKGAWSARFSSNQMAWAAACDQTLHWGIYKGEHFTEALGHTV